MNTVDLLISGSSVRQYLFPGSIGDDDKVGERSVLSFQLRAPAGALSLEAGLPIAFTSQNDFTDYGLVADDTLQEEDYGLLPDTVTETLDMGSITGTVIYGALDIDGNVFTGTIEDIREARLDIGKSYILYDIRCTDNHQIFDRITIAEAYQDITIGDLIDDLFSKYFNAEGITKGRIDGVDTLVSEAVFNYATGTEAMNKISQRTGYVWYIDADKKLNLCDRTQSGTPWPLTDDSPVRNLSIISHREKYRNKQIIIGGTAETSEQSETFIGNGQQKSFTVGYALSQAPTITVNDVSKTVGVRGIDSGMDFYWNQNQNTITADTAPANGAVIVISFYGKFPLTMMYQDDTEITSRQGIEGGSGRYEVVESLKSLNTIMGLFDTCTDRVRQYGKMGKKIGFETTSSGLRTGMILPVSLTLHSIDTDMLITDIRLAESGKPEHFVYSVSAVTGEAVGGWAKFFSDFLKPDDDISLVNQNESVTTVRQFTKTWLESDSPNPFKTLYPSNSIFPSTSLRPMFHPGHEVRHIAVFNGASEVIRKFRAYQYFTAGSIRTIFLIMNNEANGSITDLGWYGGRASTTGAGTGIEMDKQAFIKTKNNLEIIQIQKTDVKGW